MQNVADSTWRCGGGKQIDVYPTEKRRFPGWKASRTSVHTRPAYESSKLSWFFNVRVEYLTPPSPYNRKMAQASPDAYLKARREFSTDQIFYSPSSRTAYVPAIFFSFKETSLWCRSATCSNEVGNRELKLEFRSIWQICKRSTTW